MPDVGRNDNLRLRTHCGSQDVAIFWVVRHRRQQRLITMDFCFWEGLTQTVNEPLSPRLVGHPVLNNGTPNFIKDGAGPVWANSAASALRSSTSRNGAGTSTFASSTLPTGGTIQPSRV
jgi:hypothetical protein